ncbi:MAG TPA: M23 family peptidase [Bradyrhizobium sp.]|nr:M23 family peptidase [Bradyrhizobium sp.]HET7885461.1 M23 family peptidase [Bradyrhizobium sp.]
MLLLVAGCHALAADEFRSPSVSVARTDWRAALDQLRTEIGSEPSVASAFTFATRRRLTPSDPRALPAFVQINAATSPIFTGISRSTVPVLLPFDTAAYLEARWTGTLEGLPLSHFQADFRPVDLFDAGPAGYDAVFSLEPGVGPPRIFAKPVEVQITGSLLIYDLNDPLGGKGESVKSLAAQYPDLRRFIREGYVRYAFTRFGIPYVVSIQCLDSAPRPRRLACREAYPVAERFLKALHVAGGLPSRPRQDIAPDPIERPLDLSADFTYRAPGDLIAHSGSRKQGGRIDYIAYSQIRFPLEKAPAFAHSQSFGKRKSSDRTDELAGGPTSYPWQDNFCEARSFGVGQCPSGFGHQGIDMRAPCPAHEDGQERCDPKQQPVVAVRDAVLIRSPKQQAATLQVNTRNEHIRFRYMHMNPAAMDADDILNGRHVAEGEKIGVVSNYLDHPNGTTRHLHFDIQVFTRDGWLWVNPYVTLVAAYERLLHGRGREVGPRSLPAAADVAHALPEDMNRMIRQETEEGGDN